MQVVRVEDGVDASDEGAKAMNEVASRMIALKERKDFRIFSCSRNDHHGLLTSQVRDGASPHSAK